METLTEQKMRVFGYMLDFAKTRNTHSLQENIKPQDKELFRTYVFCEVTDIVNYNNHTIVKYHNFRKIESAVAEGKLLIRKGLCMLSVEKEKGITAYVSLPAGTNIQFLSDASWASFKKATQ